MFKEDLSVFFDADEHGVEVILENGDIFTGNFDREYLEVLDMQGRSPVLTCPTVDAARLKRNAPLEIEGAIYLFKYAEPDGTGVSIVFLEEA